MNTNIISMIKNNISSDVDPIIFMMKIFGIHCFRSFWLKDLGLSVGIYFMKVKDTFVHFSFHKFLDLKFYFLLPESYSITFANPPDE